MEIHSAFLLHNTSVSFTTSSATLFPVHDRRRRRHLGPPQAQKLLAVPTCFSPPPIHNTNTYNGSTSTFLQMGHSRNRQFSVSQASSVFSPMALGSGTSVDTDDMFDDLFKKYGKVVFRSSDQKSPTAEIDDDAESLSFAVAAAKVASEVKAGDIKVLFVKPLVYWTRFFIIATAFSRPQIDAMGSKIRDMAEEKFGRVAAGDSKPNSWTLLDFGDVVVHIFLPQQRAFYNLEEFYGNATLIDLPFES